MYVAFTIGISYNMQILRIQNNNLGEVLRIDWHQQLVKPNGALAGNANIVN